MSWCCLGWSVWTESLPSPPAPCAILASLLETDLARPDYASCPPHAALSVRTAGPLQPATGTFWGRPSGLGFQGFETPKLHVLVLCEFEWIPWWSAVLGCRAGIWQMVPAVLQETIPFLFLKHFKLFVELSLRGDSTFLLPKLTSGSHLA